MDSINLRQEMEERSRRRREIIAQQFGIEDPSELGVLLGNARRTSSSLRRAANSSSSSSNERSPAFTTLNNKSSKESPSGDVDAPEAETEEGELVDEPEAQTADTANDGVSHAMEFHTTDEEVIAYTDNSAFLKGTQSANPHNDYCQHFVDTGQRPQNFIRDVGIHERFEEYPKLKELIKLKDDLIQSTASPPMYLKADPIGKFKLSELDVKFDVILIEPPLEEYQRTHGCTNMDFCTWDDIFKLDIDSVAAQRSFVFLWCGSSDGLDLGRRCLKKWGYRRCEDICWVKTNSRSTDPGHSKTMEPTAVFQRSKEHCLMGIKGTVRRSVDGDFIHANIDIDLIISEEPEYGSIGKPEEIFNIIEHFCLGQRRLHLFGRDSSIRPGWLTIGPGLTNSNFNADLYSSAFRSPASLLTGCTERIESLRPKSPPPKHGNNNKTLPPGIGNPSPVHHHHHQHHHHPQSQHHPHHYHPRPPPPPPHLSLPHHHQQQQHHARSPPLSMRPHGLMMSIGPRPTGPPL